MTLSQSLGKTFSAYRSHQYVEYRGSPRQVFLCIIIQFNIYTSN